MACIDDIRNKYLNIPPIPISDNNMPKYIELLNYTINSTIKEYSELRPLIKEKEFTTSSGQTTIDLYSDIDENFMDIIIFDKKSNLLNGIFIKELNRYITPIIVEKTSQISFLEIQYIYDYLFMIKEYFGNVYKRIIFNGRKLKVEPETEYYILYEAYRTADDILNSDCNNFEELLRLNLILEIVDSYMYSDEQPIRSVSISGISVTFNVDNKDTVRRLIYEAKSKIKSRLTNIYDFVDRF